MKHLSDIKIYQRMKIVFIFHFSFFITCAHAQNYISPVDIPIFLSGNFGELRNNHFHSGIDIKTEGRINIPVKAIENGYVSRIGISPVGYGNALYITHPDGKKSVYAHLNSFSPKIESLARDSQYVKQSFAINIELKPNLLPVKKGEIIANSGNSGSSGGPHLHFEIRDHITDEIYDPLPFYVSKIQDNVPPFISGLMIFPQKGKGIVNGSSKNQTIKIISDKQGNKNISPTIQSWGDIGLGIKAYDKMTGTSNTYLPKKITLEVDGEVIFSQNVNKFLFSETRYLNSVIDFDEWVDHRSFYMKSFLDPGNSINFSNAKNRGIISIKEGRTYRCKYTLSDEYGNTSSLAFNIEGQKQSIPNNQISGKLFPYNKDNIFSNENVLLEIPAGNLYTDVDFQYKETVGNMFAPTFQLGKRTPLHSYCSIKFKIVNDTFIDKSKYGIVSLSGAKKVWIGGKYTNGYISGQIRELGDYGIEIDTIPPKIVPVKPEKWTPNRKISFKVTDDLSGIDKFKGFLDGNFVLFEYDAKSASMFCVFDPKRMKKGKQYLTFKVWDSCGNESVYERDVAF